MTVEAVFFTGYKFLKFYNLLFLFSVITSYSIHYTKLYEGTQVDVASIPDVWFFQKVSLQREFSFYDVLLDAKARQNLFQAKSFLRFCKDLESLAKIDIGEPETLESKAAKLSWEYFCTGYFVRCKLQIPLDIIKS